MRPCFVSLLISSALVVTPAWGHDLSPEQRINKLHVRILDVDRGVDTVFWIAVAAYLTAAMASGAICARFAQQKEKKHALRWFLAGVLLPVVVVPLTLVLHSQSVERIFSD